MKKSFLFIILLIFLVPQIYAECEYTKEVVTSSEVKFLPFDYKGNQLKEVQITINSEWNQPAKIINLNDYDLKVKIKINLNIKQKDWCDSYTEKMNSILEKELIVPGNDYVELPVVKPTTNFYCNEFRWTAPYEIQYENTDFVTVKPTTVENKTTVCLGKNNGYACISSNECGSKFCIEGYCSNTNTCYNNDCKCPSNKIQCGDNGRCVLRNDIGTDSKPTCGLVQECKTGYIDQKTGNCAKSPTQIRIDTGNFLIVLISIIFVGLIGLYFLSIHKKKIEIDRLEKEIRKLELIKEGLTDLEIKLRFKEIYFKIYTDRILVNSQGYIIFRDSGEPIHRYFYRSHYNDFRSDFEIHHIDKNKVNNQLYNLIQLSVEKHKKIIHGKIVWGDWKSGIKELRRIGLSEKDFPEEVKKYLDNKNKP